MESRLLSTFDSYVKECAATVLAVENDAVALDQTPLYPGGGGQPSDTGRLIKDQQQWPITAARKDERYVWHTLAGDHGLAVGDEVRVEIDWARRYLLMRTHTALHMLSAVAFRDYGASVTGGNMDTGEGRLDFEVQNFTPELAQEMIRKVNQEVDQAREVKVYQLPRAEAFELPDLIRTKTNLVPEGVTHVRIVEIAGLDRQADGGTHVHNTAEVGGITLVKTRSKGATNKRIIIGLAP